MRHHQPHPLHFACAMVGAVPYPDAVEWLLTPGERGNGQTRLDDGHQGRAWSEGNLVRPRIHGATSFANLYHRLQAPGAVDSHVFPHWPDRPHEHIAGPTRHS